MNFNYALIAALALIAAAINLSGADLSTLGNLAAVGAFVIALFESLRKANKSNRNEPDA